MSDYKSYLSLPKVTLYSPNYTTGLVGLHDAHINHSDKHYVVTWPNHTGTQLVPFSRVDRIHSTYYTTSRKAMENLVKLYRKQLKDWDRQEEEIRGRLDRIRNDRDRIKKLLAETEDLL